MSAAASAGNQGPATDQNNVPVVDPTENVMKLVEAASHRIDDLARAESRRLDELRAAESHRLEDMMALRADYETKLREAEAKRIDAIRAVDVNAVAVASQRAADQATVLANQVVQSAEALRTLVASTAATVATSQQQLATTLSARLTTLEQAGYQQQGKSTRDDPMMQELITQVRGLAASRDTTGGERRGGQQMWAYIVAGLGLLFGLAQFLSHYGKP